MPYICKEGRLKYRTALAAVKAQVHGGTQAAELNYLLSSIVKLFLDSRHKENYGAYNDVIGALECAKLELYRRKISKYEKKKLLQNGDI